jgi:hypothetical protein
MIHITDIYELKAKLYKLKFELDNEPANIYERDLAQKYLSKAIDCINELPLT